jgi:ubiquinone/menaquinone biosynthesis C-methylase UbiE
VDPDPFSRSAVQAAYDAVAEDYLREFGDDLDRLPVDRAMVDATIAAKPEVGPLLDLGCGPGHVSSFIADRGVPTIGLDLSSAMAALAKARDGRLRPMVADMRALPVASASAAGVVALYSLQHVVREDLDAVLAEVRRVVQPSGALLVAVHLGEGEIFVDRFLGHEIAPVGGTLFARDDLVGRIEASGFTIELVRERAPLPHEHDTQRLYLLASAAAW